MQDVVVDASEFNPGPDGAESDPAGAEPGADAITFKLLDLITHKIMAAFCCILNHPAPDAPCI